MRSWHLSDIIVGRDGKVALTKLAAATFHLNIAAAAAYLTYTKQSFDLGMWTLYASVAVGHAVYDKTAAQIKDLKEQKINGTPAPSSAASS